MYQHMSHLDGGVLGGQLTTDANAVSVSGTFTIPNTATTRFRIGERIFRLTSSSTNATDNDVDTFAEGRYTARGLQVTLNKQYSQLELHQLFEQRTVSDSCDNRCKNQQIIGGGNNQEILVDRREKSEKA